MTVINNIGNIRLKFQIPNVLKDVPMLPTFGSNQFTFGNDPFNLGSRNLLNYSNEWDYFNVIRNNNSAKQTNGSNQASSTSTVDLTGGTDQTSITDLTEGTNLASTVGQAASTGISTATDYLANKASNEVLGNDTELGRNLGALFSSGVSSAGNTLSNNILKGTSLTEGLGQNVGAALGGTAAGIAGNYIGKGISSLGGNSMLSRGVGQGVATGIGTIGGQIASNLLKGEKALAGFTSMTKGAKAAIDAAKAAGDTAKVAKLTNATKFAKASNIIGLAGQVVGSGLLAALGSSKEYGGRYGKTTQIMDTAYDIVQAGVGVIPGWGLIAAGAMALNKGLSNVFGSTSGMTKTDAILGSAFMPAPVKWANMWGASTTGNFNNQSWLNTEKVNSFMGNAFGNLQNRFDRAREEAGKTYGTFSQGAYRDALNNLRFANNAWNQVLDMADQNEYQNIRSQAMSSINNLRYAQMIQGGYNPIARGKQGMKIFNNATNHNIGMRLLSAAALIDDKAMILCSVVD